MDRTSFGFKDLDGVGGGIGEFLDAEVLSPSSSSTLGVRVVLRRGVGTGFSPAGMFSSGAFSVAFSRSLDCSVTFSIGGFSAVVGTVPLLFEVGANSGSKSK